MITVTIDQREYELLSRRFRSLDDPASDMSWHALQKLLSLCYSRRNYALAVQVKKVIES